MFPDVVSFCGSGVYVADVASEGILKSVLLWGLHFLCRYVAEARVGCAGCFGFWCG